MILKSCYKAGKTVMNHPSKGTTAKGLFRVPKGTLGSDNKVRDRQEDSETDKPLV